MNLSEFDIHEGPQPVTCLLAEPGPADVAAQPELLMAFAGGRRSSLTQSPYGDAARDFVAAGHSRSAPRVAATAPCAWAPPTGAWPR